MFGNADYFFQSGGPITPVFDVPVNGNAWNHGGIQPEIANIWLGLVGPAVRKGSDDDTDQGEGESAGIEFPITPTCGPLFWRFSGRTMITLTMDACFLRHRIVERFQTPCATISTSWCAWGALTNRSTHL